MASSKKPPTKIRYPTDAAALTKPSYRVAKTRDGARSVAGHFPAEQVKAFRVLAASEEKDVQQLLAEAINLLFKQKGVKARIPVFSGRRTRAHTGA